MKKYIFAALAVAGSLFTTSCSDDDAYVLEGIRVSSSYVAIPVEGGSQAITVNCKNDWTLKVDSIANPWLIVNGKFQDEVKGLASDTLITFSADATLDGRSAELLLTSGNEVQHINVMQGVKGITTATCAEIIAGPDKKTYQVTGIVTAIANTTYGNFYLADETGQIYIYGTVDASGSYNWAKFGIEVGDEVTVAGPKTTYNGIVELVDATFIKVNKSLIKVAETDPEDGILPIEGGKFTVNLECKGNGVSVTVPEDAVSWLSISSVKGNTVVFNAAPNEGGDRETTITFTTTDGKKDYTAQTTLTQKGAIIEVNIADFNAAEVGNTQYRVTGVVSEINNAAKGRFYIKDYTGDLYVYNMSGFADTGIKVGDIVTLVGKRDQYNTTIEMTSAIAEDIKVVKEVSIAEFIALPDSKTDYYMVTGTISDIVNTTYGNLNLTDGTNKLYVYGCYPGYGASGDARKNFLATAGIEAGDKLTMIGYKDTYNGTIELCGGIYFSHSKPE